MDDYETILTVDRILIAETSKEKSGILLELTETLRKSKAISEPERIYEDILERERIMSTGIGAGIAIPHIHRKYVGGVLAALAILKKPLDFNSIDGSPVQFIIMVLSSGEDHERYLKVIAKFAHALAADGVRNRLLLCDTSEEALSVLRLTERKPDTKQAR